MPAPPQASKALGAVTPFFEANEGQFDADVTFVCRLPHKMFVFRSDGLNITLNSPDPEQESYTIQMRYLGIAESVHVEGVGLLQGKINYMIGQNRDGWKTGVPTYRKIRYNNLYEDIDALYYAEMGLIEYDLILHPGAKASDIRMQYDGVKSYTIDGEGNLVVDTGWDTFAELAPKAYQVIDGTQHTVDVRFAIQTFDDTMGATEDELPAFAQYIGFELGEYDRDYDVVIDPVIQLQP